jgi:hypothetical protein
VRQPGAAGRRTVCKHLGSLRQHVSAADNHLCGKGNLGPV